ncbi:MAG: LicD family protein [Prevotella sp.]|nr:LicD family protein [Prevotella sp.]
MALYDIRPLQLRILKIMQAVDVTCREHGLHYYLWAGSMIGAIRHKGFIPWDDDLDIAMPRPDYDRLIAHAREWLPEPFEMVCAENDAVYPLPFAKIQDSSTTLIERMHLKYLGGIYLDVFPIDGVPEGWLKQKWHFGRYEYYKRVLYLLFRDPYKHGYGPSCWIPLLCRKLYSLEETQVKIRRILTKYDYNQSKYVADYDDGSKGVMDKSVLGTPTSFEFEGVCVKGVEHYDTYLSNKYGDYMKIPDGNHQRQHNFHYLDLEHSYKTYQC